MTLIKLEFLINSWNRTQDRPDNNQSLPVLHEFDIEFLQVSEKMSLKCLRSENIYIWLILKTFQSEPEL